MNLKKKNVDSTTNTQKCFKKKFLIENYFDLPPVYLELRISPRIAEKKIEMALKGYSEAWGKLIHKKTLN